MPWRSPLRPPVSETTPQTEETFVRWLREAGRVMAFCGAGVSVESGLPTFRGGGGLWEGHRVEDVATPEAFARDPVNVWRFYANRQAALQEAVPNPAHRVLAEMERRYDDFLLATQNVDDLHERAGSTRLLKIHGSLMEVRCSGCGEVSRIGEPVHIEGSVLPLCACGALLRPNVVWFGELLDPDHFEQMQDFFRRCPLPVGSAGSALLLIIGTSGLVSSGYGVTWLARRFGARIVEINPEASAHSHEADLLLRAPAGELLARIWPRVLTAES